ncbi:hypothetical protein EMCRGX_G029410 [Ephydatia muelleri]
MYRTRSPLKGKQETTSEGSLDQALQAIREQLSVLSNERRAMETRVETLTSGARAACMQLAARRSFVPVQRTIVTDDFRAALKTTTVKAVDEVDYAASKEADYRVANQDRSPISSAGSSHESLLTRNSPDMTRTGYASFNYTVSSPGQLSHATMRTTTEETPRHSRATQESLRTPQRPNSILSESSTNLPSASSQLSIDKTDDELDDAASKYYSSSLALNDSRISPPHQPDTSARHAHSDSKRAGGSTTIVRRSSETGQLEHFRKPNRYMSFSNSTKMAVSAQPLRRNSNSPNHEKQKYLKRTSVILPGIETTV